MQVLACDSKQASPRGPLVPQRGWDGRVQLIWLQNWAVITSAPLKSRTFLVPSLSLLGRTRTDASLATPPATAAVMMRRFPLSLCSQTNDLVTRARPQLLGCAEPRHSEGGCCVASSLADIGAPLLVLFGRLLSQKSTGNSCSAFNLDAAPPPSPFVLILWLAICSSKRLVQIMSEPNERRNGVAFFLSVSIAWAALA